MSLGVTLEGEIAEELVRRVQIHLHLVAVEVLLGSIQFKVYNGCFNLLRELVLSFLIFFCPFRQSFNLFT